MRRAEAGARLHSFLLGLALAVPAAYHGVWNLSTEGRAFWTEDSGLPPVLRYVVGASELLASGALVTGCLRRSAAVGLLLIFVGAIPHHVAAGYSFKHGGYEPLLVYATVALAIALQQSSSRKKR